MRSAVSGVRAVRVQSAFKVTMPRLTLLSRSGVHSA